MTAHKPQFHVPEKLINDWTGDRWAKNWETFGLEMHPPEYKSKEEQEADAKKFQAKLDKYQEKFKKKDEDEKVEF